MRSGHHSPGLLSLLLSLHPLYTIPATRPPSLCLHPPKPRLGGEFPLADHYLTSSTCYLPVGPPRAPLSFLRHLRGPCRLCIFIMRSQFLARATQTPRPSQGKAQLFATCPDRSVLIPPFLFTSSHHPSLVAWEQCEGWTP